MCFMKRFQRNKGSTFKYFFTRITATVLVCILLSSFVLLFLMTSFWKSDIYTGLGEKANGVVRVISSSSDSERYSAVVNSLLSLSYASTSDIFIVDKNGKIAICRDMKAEEEYGSVHCPLHESVVLPKEMFAEISRENPEASYEGEIDAFGGEDFFASMRFLGIFNGVEYYVVSMEASESAYQPYTTIFLRIIILTGLVAVLISFFASLSTSYRMAKPIRKITAATKQYAGGDFSVKIKSMNTYSELGTLIDSVNSMADSLSVLEESRSNFVANVSHELKTPITIIGGFIDGILDGTISGDDREKYLQIVSSEVKRLSQLVVAMLNMSKIEAGKLTLSKSSVNLQRMLFSILLSFEKKLEEKQIIIDGMDKLENITIEADNALINQILYNLIDNAVKFTPESGTITLGVYSEKKSAHITIRNTGAGIPHADANLIFDRFYKVDKSRGLDSHSFGMGLYIVKSIVELHGGTITLESEVGEYTEFHIILPL